MQTILTPATHPDHHTVGHDFVGGMASGRWLCDSYDPSMGYWMTPRQPFNLKGEPLTRTNVSERAIGATFHKVYVDVIGDRVDETTTIGWLSFLRRWQEAYPNLTPNG